MAKEPTSLRLDPALKAALDQRARDADTSTAALVERLLAEALRHDENPLIVFRDGAGGRRAALAGSRLTVAQVIDTVMSTEGDTAAKIRGAAEYLQIAESHVRACVRYYAAYTEEIDEQREREAEAARRAEDAWRREQAVLT